MASVVVPSVERAVPAGRQEFEPPAPRRVVSGDGTDSCWWGVDPSTQRMSVGVVRADGSRHVETRSFRRCRDSERLAHVYAESWDFANELRDRFGVPGFCWIEQPFGQHVSPVSYMVCGVLAASVWRLLNRLTGRDVPVEMVPVPVWKKLALGRGFGGARKPVVMRWARQNGYEGVLEDEADALGIAVAASRAVGFR